MEDRDQNLRALEPWSPLAPPEAGKPQMLDTGSWMLDAGSWILADAEDRETDGGGQQQTRAISRPRKTVSGLDI